MTAALRTACTDYQLTSATLLLVCATTRPAAMSIAAAEYGVPRPSGSATEPVQAYAASLCDFSRQYPDQLLARPGTGRTETAPDPDTGEPMVPWADLGPLSVNGR